MVLCQRYFPFSVFLAFYYYIDNLDKQKIRLEIGTGYQLEKRLGIP